MNVLITGGCGFIGTNLIRYLRGMGECRIRVLDNLSVGNRDDLAKVASFAELGPKGSVGLPTTSEVQLLAGDILDKSIVDRALRQMDVVVHLAANTGVQPSVENPELDCMTNVVGTLNCLEGARQNGVKRFVFASSGAPVGECHPPIHEEMVPHPVSPYGASKLAGEGYCSAYYRCFALGTVALRFSNVYGPGSTHKASVVAKFIKKALKGEPVEIYGNGDQTRDFLFIDDLVRAILLAATRDGAAGELFQIATNKETTVADLAKRLVLIVRETTGKEMQLTAGERRSGDVMRNFSDTSKAARLLGWQAETSLDDGLKKTINYFVNGAVS